MLWEAAQEFLIANIKLQTQNLWRVLYSMYLARLAAVTWFSINVSITQSHVLLMLGVSRMTHRFCSLATIKMQIQLQFASFLDCN